MTAIKHGEAVGVLAVVETTYGTDPTPSTSTDGVQIIKPRPDIGISFLYDGKRGLQNGGFANIAMAPKRGRAVDFTLRCEAKGNGAAYTSTAVVVPHIHALLQCAGYTAAVTTTGGSELWTFTPTAATATPKSCTVYLYTRNELLKVTGVYSSLKIVADNVGIPVFEFTCKGILSASITETALASITYHSATIIPPAAVGVTFALGNLTTPKLRSMTWDDKRSIDNPRANQIGADGHAGFSVGPRDPMAELLMESTALEGSPYTASAGYDAHILSQNATLALGFSYTCGSTQYNRWVLAASTAQVDSEEMTDETGTALTKVMVRPYTTQTSASDHTIVFS